MDKRISTKKFSRDHFSAYKGQGIKGDSFANRLVRANRVLQERKKSRVHEMNKRRRLPLSPLDNVTVSETSMISNEEHAHCGSKVPPAGNNRKDQLKKWKEEKKLKQQLEVLNNAKKRTFVVGQVKYKPPPIFVERNTLLKPIQEEKAATKEVRTRRLTRASARLAQKQVSAKPRSPVRKPLQSKTAKFTKQLDKKEQKGSKSETQTTRSAVKSSQPPNSQLRTRAQLKKKKEEKIMKISDKQEIQQTAIEEAPEKMDEKPSDEEVALTIEEVQQAPFPQFETVRDTISFGRGSTEGVKRTAQQLLTSVTEATFEPQSFAPTDFKFTVPSGVNSFLYSAANFEFKPLSPQSANAFLFPSSASFFNSPQTLTMIAAVENDRKGKEMECNFSGNNLSTNAAVQESKLEVVQESGGAGKDDECVVTITQDHPIRVNPAENDIVCAEVKSSDSCNTVIQRDIDFDNAHNSVYFRNLVKSETAKLNYLCDKWEAVSTVDLTEEVRGQIRTVIGQAQLLIDQRFKQFSGLIDLSENKTAEKKATSSDLQGFWEMIYFQVEDVVVKFNNLDKLEANDWKVETKQVKKGGKKLKSKKKPAETTGPSKVKGAKNRLQEMRAAMKAKMKEQKAKMASQKTSDQTEDLAFLTILTPVKRKACSDEVQDVVLTPVRRSARKIPKQQQQQQSVSIVSTPKLQNDAVAALRLTPEAASLGQLKEHVPEEEQITIADDTIKSDAAVITDDDSGNKGEEVFVTTGHLDGRMITRRKSRVSFAPNSPVKRMKRTPGNTSIQSPILTSTGEGSVVTPDLCSPAVTKSSKSNKRSVNRRRSSMRNRVPTPYYPGRSTSRIKDKDDPMETDSPAVAEETDTAAGETGTPLSSQGGGTTPLNGSVKKTASSCCQSVGKTPSTFKLQSPTALDSSPPCDKLPSDVSVNLFGVNCQPNYTTDTDDFSSKYLCPTNSGDENNKTEPDRESTNADLFENNECQEMSDDSLVSPETIDQNPGPRVSLLGSEPRRWHTPVILISCPSDMDTPSPSSCPITPMPLKTTWFISPLQNGGNKVTPYIPDSTLSPNEEGVSQESVLVPVTPEVTRPKKNHLKIASKLETFHIQSPARKSDPRRDSVFFAPVSGDAGCRKSNTPAEPASNLISFSPDITKDASNKEILACGSVKRFAAITPSKKVRNFLGTDCVLSPVRRSARLHMDDSSSVTSLQVSSVSELPSDLDFGYQPNPSLTNI